MPLRQYETNMRASMFPKQSIPENVKFREKRSISTGVFEDDLVEELDLKKG